MDIFSVRACTRQSRLQVELAQLRYSLPRLKRMWTHLSRFEGGIGMRGPGETQLEEDKRIIGRRIQKLERELKNLAKQKEASVGHRRGEFVVALVGYTNAGKSTLLNRLTGSKEMVEDRLFATLDTRVRRWPLDAHQHVLLTDTVGFIKRLPHHLVASFHATLAETHFRISAQTGAGLDELGAAVVEGLHQQDREIDILVPHHRGDLLSYLSHNGRVLTNEYSADGTMVKVLLSPARLGKLKALYPQGFEQKK